jgi:hypothetical protein
MFKAWRSFESATHSFCAWAGVSPTRSVGRQRERREFNLATQPFFNLRKHLSRKKKCVCGMQTAFSLTALVCARSGR